MDEREAWLFTCGVLSPWTPDPLCRELEEAIARRRVSWERVAALASAHLVTPALFTRLHARSWLPNLDSEVRTYLETVADLNRNRNHGALLQLEQVAEALNAIGIEPVLLKGAALLVGRVYPDPADRIISDLDLLVPEELFGPALEALRALGYRPADGRNYDHHHHSAPLLHPDWQLAVELHRDVLNAAYRDRLPAGPLIERSRSQACHAHIVRLPAPEDLFVHNVLHHQLADRRLWTLELRLRDACDLVWLAARFPERLRAAPLAGRVRRVAGAASMRLYVGSAFAAFHAPDPLAWRSGETGLGLCTEWLFRQAREVQMRPGLVRLRAAAEALSHLAQIVRRSSDRRQRRHLARRARQNLLQSVEALWSRRGV